MFIKFINVRFLLCPKKTIKSKRKQKSGRTQFLILQTTIHPKNTTVHPLFIL